MTAAFTTMTTVTASVSPRSSVAVKVTRYVPAAVLLAITIRVSITSAVIPAIVGVRTKLSSPVPPVMTNARVESARPAVVVSFDPPVIVMAGLTKIVSAFIAVAPAVSVTVIVS